MDNTIVRKHILDMLEKNPACSRKEMCDRLYYDYKVRPCSSQQVKRIIESMQKDTSLKVESEVREFPKLKPFIFTYSSDRWNSEAIENTIKTKLEAFRRTVQHSNDIGDFLELEVKDIMEERFGYNDVERRKESEDGESIYPDEIDVFCHDEGGMNLALQVKNRKQPFSTTDVDTLFDHQMEAFIFWGKPTYGGIISTFINKKAKQLADSYGTPWVQTNYVFIPPKLWPDYAIYRNMCCAQYYIPYDIIWRNYLEGQIGRNIINLSHLRSTGQIKSEPLFADLLKNVKTPEDELKVRRATLAKWLIALEEITGHSMIDDYVNKRRKNRKV